MGIAKVTRNYQVTIPRDVRRVQGINIGDTVLFAIEGERINVMKMERENAINAVAGTWKDDVKGSSTDYVRNMRTGWAKRSKRLGL